MNEIEALKQELKQTKLAYLMATEIGQFKSGFLARTAHELRSPLSSLIGLHQIILSDLCENPQEERDFLAQSYQAAQQFLKLLDELIEVSKIDCGAIELEIRPVCLTQVFSELHQLTYLQAKNRRLDLEIVSPPSDLSVMADYQHLLQVLVNLVDTSVSHLKEGKIRVVALAESGSSKVAGCIDLDCPVNIWCEPIDLFQPASKPPSIAKPTLEKTSSFAQNIQMSSGMKLWVAQSLLEAMGGRLEILEISSEVTAQKITRLRCRLPIAPVGAIAPEWAEG
jgi:K+-sensing histidine kinase KdpD